MALQNIDDLLQQFSKATVSSESTGVSFRGKNLKLNNETDCLDVVKAIEECCGLTFLDLEGNSLGVEAAKAIGKALESKPELQRALWKDLFTGRMKTEIPKALTFLSNGLTTAGAKLRELDLSDNAFGPIGVEALVKLLQSPVCYELQELRLNNNGLGVTGGKMLATALLALHANSTAAGTPAALKVFIAGRNRLENPGATALAEVFQAFGTLEEIAMPQNGIYHLGISELSNAFKSNPNLRILNLNDNTLTAKGGKSLAEALPSLQNLQILNLGDCLLKTKGALVLAEALSDDHQQLEEVLLDSNEIHLAGGEALARALKGKPKLKKLSLGDNLFNKSGRLELRNILKCLDCPSDEDEDDIDTDDETEEDEGSEKGTEEESEEEDCSSPQQAEDEEVSSSTPTVNGQKQDSPVRSNCTPVLSNATTPIQNSGSTPVHNFVNNPSADNFTRILSLGPQGVMDQLRNSDGSLDEELFVLLIMKVSNLGINKNDAVKKQSRDFAVSLYKALFTWADKTNRSSVVNNTLFVYLDLIKDEDNRLKISWDVDTCVKVLQAAIVEKIVPGFTQHILTCCLERKFNKTIEHVSIS